MSFSDFDNEITEAGLSTVVGWMNRFVLFLHTLETFYFTHLVWVFR